MTTTALLCVARNERPFTAEWLEYHLGIGFDRVYYVSTDSDFSSIREYFDRSPFRSQTELTHFDALGAPGWQARCYNQHLPSIREDWVLPLDVDEFLYLHSWASIQEFLDSVPDRVNQIQFPWLNLISSDYWHDRTFDLLSCGDPHVSDHVKSIVRVRDLIRCGVHAHSLRDPKSCLSSGREVSARPRHGFLLDDPRAWIEHPLILHFGARGHMDSLIRIVEQGFHNQKCGPVERRRLRRYLREASSWANIPTRYMLMQLWSSMPKADCQLRLPKLDSRTDVLDLKATFRDSMNRLLGFDGPIEDVAERFENRYHLARKLRAQNQAAHYEISEYLKYRTQVEYLQARRKSLETPPADRSQAESPRVPRVKPVFIHVSSNAGNSILSWGGTSILNAGHRTALSWVRDQGDERPLFAVVRNPFDRVVSEYFDRKRRFDAGEENAHLSNLYKSFEDWTLSTFRDGELRTRAFFEDTGIPFNERNMIDDRLIWFVPQMGWLGDGHGHLLVRDLLRFENLEWDWSRFADKHSLSGELFHRNVSIRTRDYRTYYSAETRNLIADYYRQDLEAFGYAF